MPLTGAAQPVTLANDEVTVAFPIGFTTRFFGRTTDLFWVGSNGFVTLHFLTPHGCCDGQPLPSAGGPDGMVAAFWTDLDPSLGGAVRFERMTLEGQQALVVDYDHVPVAGALGGTATFQFVLFQNGTFDVRVEDAVAGPGRTFSVGAENLNASLGVEVVRATGGLSGVGFRFAPAPRPVLPPVLHGVSPGLVSAGSFVRAFGEHFEPGALVRLDGTPVGTVFESETSLGFAVPSDALPGRLDVTVVNPDGNATTLPDALEVTDALAISSVFPASLRQGDLLVVRGSGFGPGAVLLVGGRPLEARREDAGTFVARLPAAFPPGLHEVAVSDPARGAVRLADALLVQGRPDLVVASLRVERHEVGLAGGPTVGMPGSWLVTAVVRNAGDATATGLTLTLRAQNAQGPLAVFSRADERTETRDELAPGASWSVEMPWGNGLEVGDMEFLALVVSSGVRDRDASNDAARARGSAYVTGLGGLRPDGCEVPEACEWPEWRHVREERRRQADEHDNATLRLDAAMEDADFTFDRFDMVFTATSDLPGGGIRDCITWRFLGGPAGVFRVRMQAGNGIEGLATVVAAGASRSNGTVSTEEWRELRAFGAVLWDVDRATTPGNASEPLFAYEYASSPSATWTLAARGLTGDFTHCTEFTDEGRRERFVYAALPPDPSVPVAGFDGAGLARLVSADFEGTVREERSEPLVA